MRGGRRRRRLAKRPRELTASAGPLRRTGPGGASRPARPGQRWFGAAREGPSGVCEAEGGRRGPARVAGAQRCASVRSGAGCGRGTAPSRRRAAAAGREVAEERALSPARLCPAPPRPARRRSPAGCWSWPAPCPRGETWEPSLRGAALENKSSCIMGEKKPLLKKKKSSAFVMRADTI